MILVREGAEIYLVQRHPRSGFFGGAHVFPGGKLDDSDFADDMLERLTPGAVERCAQILEPTPGFDLPKERAAGLFVAACRELFEEAGILLAANDDGHTWQPPPVDTVVDWRDAVVAGELGFAELLNREKLRLRLDDVAYWSHWVTPSFEPKRYDTRFFIAKMPAGAEARIDSHEATAQRWGAAAATLEAYAGGEMLLPPPTLCTLEEIADLVQSVGTSVDDILAGAGRRKVVPIQPKIAQIDEKVVILLPWDPVYDETDGERLAGSLDYPAEVTNGPSRIVMIDGRWTTARA